VRALEEWRAGHEAWGRESAKNMQETFKRLEQVTNNCEASIGKMDDKMDGLRSTLDKTTTRVGMMVVGASVLVSVIMGVIHYATR
jgi:hypothetical protein